MCFRQYRRVWWPGASHLELYAVATSETFEPRIFGCARGVENASSYGRANLETATSRAARCSIANCRGQAGALFCSGADGPVRVRRYEQVSVLVWLQCVGGPQGVTALCLHPDPHGVISFWATGAAPPGAQTETSSADVLQRERAARGIPACPLTVNHADTSAAAAATSTNGNSDAADLSLDSELVLCIGGADGSVQFWDVRGSLSINHAAQSGHRGAVVTLLPVDGSHVVSGGVDEYWRLWDGMHQPVTQTYQEVRIVQWHTIK